LSLQPEAVETEMLFPGRR